MMPSRIQYLQRLELPTEFPARFFPGSVEAFRRMLTKSADTCDDFAIAHIVTAAGVAIGKHASAVVQGEWTVKSQLFMALVGFKGAGKSSLAAETFAPLYSHEEDLAKEAAQATPRIDDPTDRDEVTEEDEEIHAGESPRSEPPPVIATDVTGPAIIRILAKDPRLLLVHTDELAALMIKNTGGTDRQLFCELADGRRRRQCRATERGAVEADRVAARRPPGVPHPRPPQVGLQRSG